MERGRRAACESVAWWYGTWLRLRTGLHNASLRRGTQWGLFSVYHWRGHPHSGTSCIPSQLVLRLVNLLCTQPYLPALQAITWYAEEVHGGWLYVLTKICSKVCWFYSPRYRIYMCGQALTKPAKSKHFFFTYTVTPSNSNPYLFVYVHSWAHNNLCTLRNKFTFLTAGLSVAGALCPKARGPCSKALAIYPWSSFSTLGLKCVCSRCGGLSIIPIISSLDTCDTVCVICKYSYIF